MNTCSLKPVFNLLIVQIFEMGDKMKPGIGFFDIHGSAEGLPDQMDDFVAAQFISADGAVEVPLEQTGLNKASQCKLVPALRQCRKGSPAFGDSVLKDAEAKSGS